ncbi:MAG: integration host factor subunit alpha [Zetaproteobacteria bacterium]|nr:integration host factor subunit alpha [Zetaproteobacteria bacterium]
MTDRLTKALIAERVNERVGISKKEATQMIETILETIKQHLQEGEDVKLSGFGHFILRDKKERLGRNPRTGEDATISSRRVVSFRPSRRLRQVLAGDEA